MCYEHILRGLYQIFTLILILIFEIMLLGLFTIDYLHIDYGKYLKT